jgi:hypothetical protein
MGPIGRCVHCVLELSCDQREWFEVHSFVEGAGELAEWDATDSTTQSERIDGMGFAVEQQVRCMSSTTACTVWGS